MDGAYDGAQLYSFGFFKNSSAAFHSPTILAKAFNRLAYATGNNHTSNVLFSSIQPVMRCSTDAKASEVLSKM